MTDQPTLFGGEPQPVPEPDAEPSPKREPHIYRCAKHNYELVSTGPVLKSSLKVFCPICRDEFWEKHIGALENENPNAGKVIKE